MEVVAMTAQNEKKEFRKNVPALESHVRMSEDRKWVLTKIVITDIRPALYLEKMLAGDAGVGE